MRILVKALLCLMILGVVAIVAYAVFSDLPAPSRQVELPVRAK